MTKRCPAQHDAHSAGDRTQWRHQLLVIVSAGIAFVVIFLYANLFEYTFHRWRINFNVVLPLAVLVFRTFRATSLRAGPRMLRREPVTTGSARHLLRATSPARAHFAAAMMSARRAFMTRS